MFAIEYQLVLNADYHGTNITQNDIWLLFYPFLKLAFTSSIKNNGRPGNSDSKKKQKQPLVKYTLKMKEPFREKVKRFI